MKFKKPYKIIYFQQIDSTNTYAYENLAELSDRQVIIAEKQTSGKGRLNRSVVSYKEEYVYLSIVLKPFEKIAEMSSGELVLPQSEDLPLSNLTQYMSVVICKVLEDYGIISCIKWPNDVLVEDKKIAGILSRLSVQGNRLKGFVLGTGINLNLSAKDLEQIDQPATALNLLLGKPVHRDTFTENLLDSFFENYELFLGKGFSFIKNDYIKRANFIGKQIAVTTLDSIKKGTAKEIRNDGSLVILDAEMNEKIIRTGDITYL